MAGPTQKWRVVTKWSRSSFEPRQLRQPTRAIWGCQTARVAAERSAIAVLGAGPAGAAAALGLAALGYDVCVVAQPRARAGRESFSARVVAALHALGVEEALAALSAPCARAVHWAGDARALAGEAQVERAAFDAGLAAALARRGVRVLRGEVQRVSADASGARIALASGEVVETSFVIEARGRAAPASGARERGPETTCVVLSWRVPVREPRIAVASLANGWAWCADDGHGALTTQLARGAREAPARAELAARSEAALRAHPLCTELLRDAAPSGEPFARAATPVFDAGLVRERMLRVGDAALAVDPLSGNGVFQALSTAQVAPAVVNTLLRRPEHGALAREFYIARARDIFLRFARVSRDFYAAGAAHHGGAFWEARAQWPDAEPAHASGGKLELALRPVVCDGWIEPREVALTAARPLGTWQIAGVEIAPLVRAIQRGGVAAEAHALAALPEPARAPLLAWLRAHRVEPPRDVPRRKLSSGTFHDE